MKRNKILIVDDEKNVQEAITQLFKDDYLISTAETGEEAIEKIKEEKIDLVLLDIKLPKMNGIDLLTAIKEFNWQIPVIIISGISDIRTVVKTMRLGSYYYFDKPFAPEELKSRVKEVLDEEKNEIPVDIEILIQEISEKMLKQDATLKEADENFEKELMSLLGV